MFFIHSCAVYIYFIGRLLSTTIWCVCYYWVSITYRLLINLYIQTDTKNILLPCLRSIRAQSPNAMHSAVVNFALSALLLLVADVSAQNQQLRLLAEWKEAEYEFPSDDDRQRTLDSQEYVPGNGVPIDVDIDYGGMCV